VQPGLVAGIRTPDLAHVPLDRELGIIDPPRAPAQRRRDHELAAQPRHRADPLGKHAAHLGRAERSVGHEQRADLPQHRATVDRQREQVILPRSA
jgi:hypothetical protein